MMTTQSLKQFIAARGITAEAAMVDNNPNMDDGTRMDHYRVTLKRGRRRMTVYFSMGVALCREPTAEDVLDCLASDSASVENARSLEDWCGEYGYDTDSRKAERTYKACRQQAAHLRDFLGEDDYQELLWKTERL